MSPFCSNLSSKLGLCSTTYSTDSPDCKTAVNEKCCSSIFNINLWPPFCSKILRFILQMQQDVLEDRNTVIYELPKIYFSKLASSLQTQISFCKKASTSELSLFAYKQFSGSLCHKKKKYHLAYLPVALQTPLDFLHL